MAPHIRQRLMVSITLRLPYPKGKSPRTHWIGQRDCIVLDGKITDELERNRKEAFVACARLYPDIYLEGLRKTMKNFSSDSNRGLRECNPRALSLDHPVYLATLYQLHILSCT
jgi:hypothetical protein